VRDARHHHRAIVQEGSDFLQCVIVVSENGAASFNVSETGAATFNVNRQSLPLVPSTRYVSAYILPPNTSKRTTEDSLGVSTVA
jgi:hypothetical protein